VLLGIRFLADRPKDADGLAPEERRALEERRLEAEADETRTHGCARLGQALTTPRVIELGLLYFCIVAGTLWSASGFRPIRNFTAAHCSSLACLPSEALTLHFGQVEGRRMPSKGVTSEFGCRGSYLWGRLNLTWSEPPYNLRKRLDVLIKIHIFLALILSKSGEWKQVCGELAFFLCNFEKILTVWLRSRSIASFEGQQRQTSGGNWVPRPTFVPGFSLRSKRTRGFCLGLPGVRAALGAAARSRNAPKRGSDAYRPRTWIVSHRVNRNRGAPWQKRQAPSRASRTEPDPARKLPVATERKCRDHHGQQPK
jgi:hypothetical protein